jgi:hypothetical protein
MFRFSYFFFNSYFMLRLKLTKEFRTNEFNKFTNMVAEGLCPLYITSPPIKAKKRSVKIVVDDTKDRIGYASKRTTCHSTAPRCLADGSFRLKLVDSQTEGKKSLFVTALMKTFVLQCVYREHICSPDVKLIVQGTVLKTLIGIKCIFSTAYLYKKV